jgi:hypothetical protein
MMTLILLIIHWALAYLDLCCMPAVSVEVEDWWCLMCAHQLMLGQ